MTPSNDAETDLVASMRRLHPELDSQDFNSADFVHALGAGQDALLYSAVLWPTFVIFVDRVFLAWNLEGDEARASAERLLASGRSLQEVQKSINTVEPPTFKSYPVAWADHELLAKRICSMWRAKLATEFPSRNHQVVDISAEFGDPAITFFEQVGEVGTP